MPFGGSASALGAVLWALAFAAVGAGVAALVFSWRWRRFERE